MNTFLAQVKLHFLCSSFALAIIFTFSIFYSSNPFETKHNDALIKTPKDDGTGECRFFEGEWVQEPHGESSLAYTNGSCVTIPDSKNCFKHGRVDTEFLHWRWKPNGCEIPRFDARKFLRIVRGKTMGFIGDSVSRNHVDSLLCLLVQDETCSLRVEGVVTKSPKFAKFPHHQYLIKTFQLTLLDACQRCWLKEEVPFNVYHDSNDRFRTWHFPNHNFTLLALWSKFLVAADELIVNGSNSGIFNLNLNKLDQKWINELPTLDYAVISDGHWFFRQLHIYQNDVKIGCVYCNGPNVTNLDITFAMRMSFRAALKYINGCTKCKSLTTLLRTFSPSHFENGTWDNGGSCNRTNPLKDYEVESSEFYREISRMQNEEIERANKECLEKKKRFEVMDITMVMAMRADGHPGSHWGDKWMKGYNDSVHWCLPGPVDVWNDFLMAHLIS